MQTSQSMHFNKNKTAINTTSYKTASVIVIPCHTMPCNMQLKPFLPIPCLVESNGQPSLYNFVEIIMDMSCICFRNWDDFNQLHETSRLVNTGFKGNVAARHGSTICDIMPIKQKCGLLRALISIRVGHVITRDIMSLFHLLTWINWIPALQSNHMPSKMRDEIYHPFANPNGSTIEIWEWICYFNPYFIMNVITHPCLWVIVVRPNRIIPYTLKKKSLYWIRRLVVGLGSIQHHWWGGAGEDVYVKDYWKGDINEMLL